MASAFLASFQDVKLVAACAHTGVSYQRETIVNTIIPKNHGRNNIDDPYLCRNTLFDYYIKAVRK
jgi:hypothetical protein